MHKEMLELAAKAYGLVEHHYTGDYVGMRELAVHGVPHCGYAGAPFNPLTDDGDALRLAVHLDMEVTVNRVDGFTEVVAGYLGDISLREMHGDDMYAATRLVITKAAAEIGRRMCQGH